MRTWLRSLIVALVTTSCSSGSGGAGSPSGPAQDSGAQTDTSHPADTSIPGDTNDPDCSEPVDERPIGSVCIHEVKGSVVAESDGTPLAKMIISVCGGVCYFGITDDTGHFDNHVGHYIIPGQFQVLVHGRPDHASLYVKLPAPDADGNIILPKSIATPKYDQVGPAMPADDGPGATVTAGDVSVIPPDGLEYDLDPEDVANGDAGRLMRSVKWTSTTPPDFVAGSDFAALYALAPFNMRFCKSRPCPDANSNPTKIPVSVKNTTSLAAGTPVEFFILGTDLYSLPRTAGTLLVQATGKVSADGKTIDTDPGQGINELSFLGVRVKK